MSALSISLINDDARMYQLFAKETAKFALSHSDKDHYIWPYLPTVGIESYQSGRHLGMAQNAGGGFANAAEVMQIYRLTGSHSASLPEWARNHGFDSSAPCPNADSAYDSLLFWEASATGSEAKAHWWNCTLGIAQHIMMRHPTVAQPLSKFTCMNVDFFVSLHELTGEAQYKQAAQNCEANCEFAYQVFPKASAKDGHTITVDAGNRSYSYWWTHGRWGSWGWPNEQSGMWTPEKTVPTWRASHNGLKTGAGGGGGGWLGTISLDSPVKMLRAAGLSNDSFARSLSRASIVGRFGHFPGDFQSKPKHTLLWESPDLADHILPQETQTTWNTGHFWPVAGVVIDFLLSDAADKSNNQILFPSTFLNGVPFGRLYSPALGAGRFYGERGVFPWIPSGLFRSVSNAQVNWVAGYSTSNGTQSSALYIALLSQSFLEEEVTCAINDLLVGGLAAVETATVWVDNTQTSPVAVRTGKFAVTIPPKGIVALKLEGAVAKTRLQHKVMDKSMPALSPRSRVVGSDAGFGIVAGVVLRWGAGMTELYCYSQANSTMFGPFVANDTRAISHIVFDTVTLRVTMDGGAATDIVGECTSNPCLIEQNTKTQERRHRTQQTLDLLLDLLP